MLLYIERNMAIKGLKKYRVSLFIIMALALTRTADIAAEPAASLQESFWNFGEIQYGEAVSKEFEWVV